MGKAQKHPLRAFTPPEEQELHRLAKATSERLDVVKRARALLAVRAGQPFTDAARETGYKSGESISQLVERFNQRGLSALLIAPGRGRKSSYTPEQKARIVQEVQRDPDRKADQTATWSLILLRNALRKTGMPQIAKETVRVALHEAGYVFGKTRTWCPTGTAVRKRKAGTVTVQDPHMQEKKPGLSRLTSRQRQRAYHSGVRMRLVPIKLFLSQEKPGTQKANQLLCRTSMYVEAPPSS
jgi:transposase